MIQGWTVSVRCPHGVAFALPLRALYSLDINLRGCEECQFEGSTREPTFRERRRLRRELKALEKGMGPDPIGGPGPG